MKINDKKTDQELVALALKDKHAFFDIVNRYQAPLRRYLARLGSRDPYDQDDVLQEIFLKVYVNLNDYDPYLKFSSWIYRIAHNETISFFRKKNIRPAPALTEEDLKQFDNIADDLDIAAEHIKQAETQIVQQALSKLDNKYRDVLVLKFIEEKSYREISDILKIPIGTVGILISRGKKLLKNILEDKK